MKTTLLSIEKTFLKEFPRKKKAQKNNLDTLGKS